ncbi:MAG: acyl-CoA dehydratase activase [Eubacteriales bacterium]|nr:acyl-CoA dehydratase activase [Eubacteriales bacterium]
MKLGIDLGVSTVKLAVVDGDAVVQSWLAPHYGRVLARLRDGLAALELPERLPVCATGAGRSLLAGLCPQLAHTEDIPAIVEGVRLLVPQAGSIIEIGSQGARFITDLDGKAPRFSVNEHCAGGTGSFFEDQMSRLGMAIEDYSRLVEQARSVPNLSGRCAVFAKTDIIHRQQEGVPKQDILLGLCYAMIRNYKATIVKNLPVKKPVVFCGGVTENAGVIRAIREIFDLKGDELIVPGYARYAAAVGAAASAARETTIAGLRSALDGERKAHRSTPLPKLFLAEGTDLREPPATEIMPSEGCYLGIDVGSTSTDLVLTDQNDTLVDLQYLRTAGDPEGVVRTGMAHLREKYGEFPILGVGITGSGRERLGRMMGADAIRDEITAQAKAAVHWVPEADTVFEIGGQDSKYISLQDGEVRDFQMNKICAAGTGSFVEEQAARMNIPIEDFGPLALTADAPCDLGERCTVFIETAIAQAEGQGASQADIAAGLCHSIVKNYLHKVVAGKPVGDHIVLQGGVDYNPGIVAAFQSACGEKVQVSPVFSISGAFGAALLAKEAVGEGKSTFLGFDFPAEERKVKASSEQIRRNKAFYKKAGQLAVEDYDAAIDPKKKTIGVPLTLIMFKFFPMVNAFFRHLGYNVILSDSSNEKTIRVSQAHAQGETCYPVKLIYGHMMDLAEKGVDYIFLPSIYTIRHCHAHAAHNYACPYMQMAAKTIFSNLGLEKRGIKLLSPTLDLDLGAQMMGLAMLEVGKELGFSKPRCLPGLLKGALAVNQYQKGVEDLGQQLLEEVAPGEKVLVLITRHYGIADPVLNMRIPELLLDRGYKLLTLGHLPGMDLDVSKDYPGMYWPFGDHILSGAKIIANHPDLYAVYLTNHGCGPDTLLAHMFREEMGEKPYLHIEVDEHFSPVGVITRIEAFLNALSHRDDPPKPQDLDILNVQMKPANMRPKPESGKKLLIPDVGLYTRYLIDYFTACGVSAGAMPPFDRAILTLGRAEMNSKEYLPLPMLVGSALKAIEQNGEALQFLLPLGYGADADGQYARAVRTILDRCGHTKAGIVSPFLEELSEKADDPALLFRALLTADVLYAAPAALRERLAPTGIPDRKGLLDLAQQVAEASGDDGFIAAVGTPMCITSLDEGILDALEQEGRRIRRMPLSEYLWFLWADDQKAIPADFKVLMQEVSAALGASTPFAPVPDSLLADADEYLPAFSGGNGRYRYAKAMQMGETASAVLAMSPRYENTAMVLQLSHLAGRCPSPIYDLSLDGDRDESGRSKLRSFLHYC